MDQCVNKPNVVWLIALLLGAAGVGFAIGFFTLYPDVKDLSADNAMLYEDNVKFCEDLKTLNAKKTQISEDATQQVQKLTVEKAALQQDIADMTEQLEVLTRHMTSIEVELGIAKKDLRVANDEIATRDGTIFTLEGEKLTLEGEISSLKTDIECLNEEKETLENEIAAKEEELLVANDEIARLKKRIEEIVESLNAGGGKGGTTMNQMTNVTAGVKGEVIRVNNDIGFCIVKLTDCAYIELVGEDGSKPLPNAQFYVKSKGLDASKDYYKATVELTGFTKEPYVVTCKIVGDYTLEDVSVGDELYLTE
jgi:outer membrane murein-binding lipoprotein Lpp